MLKVKVHLKNGSIETYDNVRQVGQAEDHKNRNNEVDPRLRIYCTSHYFGENVIPINVSDVESITINFM
jgi:hypothetical protein